MTLAQEFPTNAVPASGYVKRKSLLLFFNSFGTIRVQPAEFVSSPSYLLDCIAGLSLHWQQ
jgi:hypothetical protein